jgi:peptidoglycan/LPS O-acetylase OafA/YrhL
MHYRPEIDGLRAVAVLPVILFHAGFSSFSGGYVGVDVFFVISGYLITSILINDLEQGKFSIARFYERRARRILPALFFVMLACLPFAYMWMLPSQLKDFAQSLVAVIFFASNVLFWREDDYFAATAELKPLLHTWSLAVEEQYYFVFPVFLFLLWRFGSQRVFLSVVVVTTLSLLLAEWGWRNSPSANFYLAPTRAWELLAGSICAFMTVNRTQKSSNVLSMVGVALIVFAIFAYNDSTPFPSVYTLVPVTGTALVIVFAAQDTWAARFLSLSALVRIGLISYSAYLWHQPLFAFARLRSLTEPSPVLMSTLAIASLLLAWATWSWVEQPFRRRANPLLATRRSVLSMSGAVGAVFVAIGLAGHLGDGFEWRLNDEQQKIASYSQYPRQSFYREGTCFLRNEQTYDEFLSECSGNGEAMIIGDSHAAALASFLSLERNLSQYTASGCPPAIQFNSADHPNCLAINDYVMYEIMRTMPDYVVLHANWISY